MKSLRISTAVILFLVTTQAQAQNFINDPTESIVDRIMSIELPKYDFKSTKVGQLASKVDNSYLNNVRALTPLQLNQSGYPSLNLSETNMVMMGSMVQQSLKIGNTKTTSTYVFDMQGNLVDHQFSIPIGK